MTKDPPSTSRFQAETDATARKRILVVEDSKTDVFLIQEALAEAKVDATVEILQDGEAAAQFVDSADADETIAVPHLMLLDLNLPKKNGEQVLRRVRESRRFMATKVLIISSSDHTREREAVESLGISGYFQKASKLTEFMRLGGVVRELLFS